LGVITEAAIKIHKLPNYAKACSYWFRDVGAACRALHKQDSYGWLFNHTVIVGKHSLGMTFPPGTPASQLIPPEVDSVVMIQMVGHDDGILNRQGEIMDEIAQQEGGEVLVLPEMREDPLMVARLAGIGLTCFCEIIYPILQAPELCQYVLENFVPQYQDMMIRVPGTPIPYWDLILTGITNHAKTDFTFVYGVDVSNKQTREEAHRVYHKLLSHIYSSYGGGAPHAMAKDMYTPHWRKKLHPEYAAFLKKIKDALDPKGILNPDSFLLD
jgi:FAD/FMN-containing dehydrogenase